MAEGDDSSLAYGAMSVACVGSILYGIYRLADKIVLQDPDGGAARTLSRDEWTLVIGLALVGLLLLGLHWRREWRRKHWRR